MVCAIPRSGRLGFVGDYTGAVLTRFNRVRNWRLDVNESPEVRVYSGTRYGQQLLPGFVDYLGAFSGFGAVPPLFVGDQFTFIGYTAPTSGVPCTVGCAVSMLSMVSALTITWNWTAEDKRVFWDIDFFGIEAPTELAAFDDPCDDAVYCDSNLCGQLPVIRDPCTADTVVEFCNITQAVLRFDANLITYSNGSTACLLKREPGNLSYTLDITDQNPCRVLTIAKDYRVEIPATTGPVTNWVLEWARHTNISNYLIDTEANTMIGKTNRFMMQAVSCCVPGTPVRGKILNPAAVQLWPYATPA